MFESGMLHLVCQHHEQGQPRRVLILHWQWACYAVYDMPKIVSKVQCNATTNSHATNCGTGKEGHDDCVMIEHACSHKHVVRSLLDSEVGRPFCIAAECLLTPNCCSCRCHTVSMHESLQGSIHIVTTRYQIAGNQTFGSGPGHPCR